MRRRTSKCKDPSGRKGACGHKRGCNHLLQTLIFVQTAHYFITLYALTIPKDRHTTTSIRNDANKKTDIPLEILKVDKKTRKIELKNRRTITNIKNGANKKISASL